MSEKNPVSVSAQDGNQYVFSDRQKVKKLSEVTPDSIVTKFVFRNGQVRQHVTPLGDASKVSQLAAHGADQKFGDEFSGLDDPDDCVMAFEKLSQRLANGEWSEKRQSDGLAGTSLLLRAVVQVTGQSPDQVKALLDSLPGEDKKALKRQSEVASAIAAIQSARDSKAAAKGKLPDANAVLAKIKGVAA